VADAIDWLDANSSKSLDELKAEKESAAEAKAAEAAEEARSLVCNECGKKFRGTAQAEFHASKSGHTDFAESTEEITPLTEEEKKAKLAKLREKLAAKRAVQSEQDKIDQKRNEQINRKKTKETEDMKEQLKAKEQLKEAEKKKREKLEEIEAKKRIQAKIAADKEERRLKAEREKAERAGQALPVAATPVPAAAPSQSKPASEYTETRLRLQTGSGNIMKTFPVNTTLFEVAAAVGEEIGRDIESFTQNFPRKVFGQEFFGESLKDLKLVPSASLIVK
jgi:UBX domain-containing protein 1/4